ncbi:hypothetical protein F5Y16DRAFT_392008 [Xylariaceae sp. FL0255]|nr:hypothetical protein F5Y16DRAFT_392008 [Xylariaceae sp. FL0255]
MHFGVSRPRAPFSRHLAQNVFRSSSPCKASHIPTIWRGAAAISSTAVLQNTTQMTTLKGEPFDRTTLDYLLRNRFFYGPTASAYGGYAGLYDLGPPGCALQNAIIDTWRRHFVLEEGMYEIDCPIITPQRVLVASGHVERFTDKVVRDSETQEYFRADHLLRDTLEERINPKLTKAGRKAKKNKEKATNSMEVPRITKISDNLKREYEDVLAKIDNYTAGELAELFLKYEVFSPNGNPLNKKVEEFNLMFALGGVGLQNRPAFLRPETAQGQFLNFTRLHELNQNNLPFASASIGKSSRNEISPKSGLLRTKEFTMAEIEHYVDAEGDKSHSRFSEVTDVNINLLIREAQSQGRTDATSITVGQAVEDGIVNNETMGYFMARIQLFLVKIGIDPAKIRFREHMENEMAHYARYCVDAEVLTSYGWVEVVGCADRSAFDLKRHSEASGVPLKAKTQHQEPVEITEWVMKRHGKEYSRHFRKDHGIVTKALVKLNQGRLEKLAKELKENGKIVVDVPGLKRPAEMTTEHVAIDLETRLEHHRTHFPHVIEPSFGIGRILYCVLENVFWYRKGDKDRCVLSLPPAMAPTKVHIVSTRGNNPEYRPLMHELGAAFRRHGLSSKLELSKVNIGKCYVRADDTGAPFAITVDPISLEDQTVTLRERDSMAQVRGPKMEIVDAVVQIVSGTMTWDQVLEKFQRRDVFEDDATPQEAEVEEKK